MHTSWERVKDMHCNVALLDVSNSALDFFVENMSKISECHDEITNHVMIAELSILVILLGIELGRYPRCFELTF